MIPSSMNTIPIPGAKPKDELYILGGPKCAGCGKPFRECDGSAPGCAKHIEDNNPQAALATPGNVQLRTALAMERVAIALETLIGQLGSDTRNSRGKAS